MVVVETLRRSRANRVIDLRERDPEPRPARWPADGWSLGSVAVSGPRLAWATSGAPGARRAEGPVEVTRQPHREAARTVQPGVARTARPAPARASSRPMTPAPAARTQSRPAPSRQPAPSYSPRPASRQATRPQAPQPGRRVNLDERPHHPAVGQAQRQAQRHSQRQATPAKSPAQGPARWRVIDLSSSEPNQQWGLAAGAESQGMPGPLPGVFRLDGLHRHHEAGSRAR